MIKIFIFEDSDGTVVEWILCENCINVPEDGNIIDETDSEPDDVCEVCNGS